MSDPTWSFRIIDAPRPMSQLQNDVTTKELLSLNSRDKITTRRANATPMPIGADMINEIKEEETE